MGEMTRDDSHKEAREREQDRWQETVDRNQPEGHGEEPGPAELRTSRARTNRARTSRAEDP